MCHKGRTFRETELFRVHVIRLHSLWDLLMVDSKEWIVCLHFYKRGGGGGGSQTLSICCVLIL